MTTLFNPSIPLWDHLLGLTAMLGCGLLLFWGHRTTLPEERGLWWRSMAISAGSGALITFLGVVVLKTYGWSLFVGLPVYCGLLSTSLYTRSHEKSFWKIVKIATLTIVLLGFLILLLAVDGLICVLMALPLGIVLSLAGAFLGNILMSQYRRKRNLRRLLPAFLACSALPFLAGFESRLDLPPPSSTVESSVEIAASPEKIWRYVPVIPVISTPPEMIFRLGIAYPVESEMIGTGVGARRRCVLSTGALEEEITVWAPHERLRFDVLSCPPSMHEISIYPHLHPGHLDNFMVSEWGEFKLIALENGRTRLVGTSHYHNRMWPAPYWLPISDYIVQRIQWRVLESIKANAER